MNKKTIVLTILIICIFAIIALTLKRNSLKADNDNNISLKKDTNNIIIKYEEIHKEDEIDRYEDTYVVDPATGKKVDSKTGVEIQ